jgi:hypothetical protein
MLQFSITTVLRPHLFACIWHDSTTQCRYHTFRFFYYPPYKRFTTRNIVNKTNSNTGAAARQSSPTIRNELRPKGSNLLWSTHDQIPATTSPDSYTILPLAPATNSLNSSNFAPPGRRSSRTTSTDTAFLKTRAVFLSVLWVLFQKKRVGQCRERTGRCAPCPSQSTRQSFP